MVYAVIDTNVIVSALISKNEKSPVVEIVKRAYAGKFRVLVNNAILAEYGKVLRRPKFGLALQQIVETLDLLAEIFVNVDVPMSGTILPDPKDVVFYDVALAHQDKHASLVTGNMKHFPNCFFAVTPREFLDRLELEELLDGNFAGFGQTLNDCRGWTRYC